MAEKITIALKRGASCVGCDIAIVNFNEDLFTLLQYADVVFAPTLMDVKYDDVKKMPDKSITIGFYHGAVRNSDNEEMAHVMREKCQILIAYGACAHMGGIPGLANVTTKMNILEKVYKKTFSVENPEGTLPQESYTDEKGHKLTLPIFWEDVKALDDIVDVDYYVPACPPTRDINMQILQVVKAFVEEGKPLPPKGTIIASEKTLCDECKRKRGVSIKVDKFYRIHEIVFDQEKCFLEQGIICLGPATRAGCAAVCTAVNMPCRGCMGPTAAVTEQGASMLSAIGSIYSISEKESELPEEEIERIVSHILDPLGCFYRFSLPKSQLGRVVQDK
ncbi:MAG TPA: oxidoreductase [Spirochaetia bacterium]|nr:oxidoreductase [Spirochaetia bacterium]